VVEHVSTFPTTNNQLANDFSGPMVCFSFLFFFFYFFCEFVTCQGRTARDRAVPQRP
jgi:hypothetical protein